MKTFKRNDTAPAPLVPPDDEHVISKNLEVR